MRSLDQMSNRVLEGQIKAQEQKKKLNKHDENYLKNLNEELANRLQSKKVEN